jgi:putative OPT family oligopeptide transporter
MTRQPSQLAREELTIKAVGLGLVLSFVFGAANAYLGMRAGQTVAATIPAAVIALALFRIPWMRGTVLEQNIARTAASVGEALVAGAVFTLPAFLLAEVDGVRLWPSLRDHYWEATGIILIGGLLGVFFIILLRKPLCVDAGLPWPESVASFELVKASADSTSAPRYIFGAMAFGGLIQVLKSNRGLQVMREYLEGFIAFPASAIQNPGGTVTHHGGIPWSTPALSPALIGVGYLIGPLYASVSVAGGVLAWWVLIPLLMFFDPDLVQRLGATSAPDSAQFVEKNIVRPIAVGAMLVAAGNTMFGMRESILSSFRGAWSAARSQRSDVGGDPTEHDLPTPWVMLALAVLLIPVIVIYYHFTQGWFPAIIAAAVMMIIGFLLSAVGGYLVGLVGTSNQPVSGLTLAALVISAGVLIALGVRGKPGTAAALGVAGIVCCACAVSGSLIQDLKAGHLLGGTPWKMQLVEIVSVVLLSFFLLAPILALHEANLDTGGIGGRALPAPQAGLMAQLAKGIMSGQMAWGLLAIGVAFGFALLLCGTRAPMLIAVGMYLPFDTTAAIFLGGILRLLAARRQADAEQGTLIASGLIAGEAIVGILLAVTFLAGVESFTQWLTGAKELAVFLDWGSLLSLAGFASIAYALVMIPRRP